jgi:hypothetical protein
MWSLNQESRVAYIVASAFRLVLDRRAITLAAGAAAKVYRTTFCQQKQAFNPGYEIVHRSQRHRDNSLDLDQCFSSRFFQYLSLCYGIFGLFDWAELEGSQNR